MDDSDMDFGLACPSCRAKKTAIKDTWMQRIEDLKIEAQIGELGKEQLQKVLEKCAETMREEVKEFRESVKIKRKFVKRILTFGIHGCSLLDAFTMDGVSAIASIGTIASAAFKVIEILNTIKQGGKQRLRLLTTIGSLWAVLQSVQSHLYTEDGELIKSIPDFLGTLQGDNGVFAQVEATAKKLEARLERHKGAQKILQDVRWPFTKAEVEASISELEKLTSAINLALTASTLMTLRETQKISSEIRLATMDAEFKAMLDWISPLDFVKQQHKLNNQTYKGTGEWFLRKPEFQSWILRNASILWCPGIPGAGKTHLATIAYNHLRNIPDTLTLIVYCGYVDPSDQTRGNFLKALIRQIMQLRPELGDKLSKTYRTYSKEGKQLSIPELVTIFKDLILELKDCFIVVDALDDVREESQRYQLFLLTKLHLDALAPKRTPKAVRKALQELPSGVNDTYDQALLRIKALRDENSEEDSRYAINLLMWTTFARRPLTVAEMEHAVTISFDMFNLPPNGDCLMRASDIDPDEVLSASELTSMCAGLVIIDASDKVLFVHFTTQDYFLANSSTLFPEAHLAMARSCLTYLSMKPFQKGPCPEPYNIRALQYPFMAYCSNNIGWHGQRTASQYLTKSVLAFLRVQALVDSAYQALDDYDFLTSKSYGRPGIHPLHMAAYWGFKDVVELLLTTESIECTCPRNETPLVYAIRNRQAPVVEILLKAGANPNTLFQSGFSALYYATLLEDLPIIKLLLRREDTELKTQPSPPCDTFWMLTKLHEYPEVEEILSSRRDFDINSQEDFKNTVFHSTTC
ncbi:MAG: hypothetical protein Q9167_003025 [Letrouitia subvulpina]